MVCVTQVSDLYWDKLKRVLRMAGGFRAELPLEPPGSTIIPAGALAVLVFAFSDIAKHFRFIAVHRVAQSVNPKYAPGRIVEGDAGRVRTD